MPIDFLHEYPVNTLPQTWGLNDVFLNSVNRMHNQWKRRGYSWRLGQEIEFIPYTFSEFREFYDNDKIDIATSVEISPYLKPSADLYTQLRNNEEYNNDYAHKALSRLIGYVRRAKDIPEFAKNLNISPEEIIEQLRGFQRALNDDDPDIHNLARNNAYLAYLHLLPFSKGGLRDVIEPRFGSYRLGLGWWDNNNVAELRTPATENPFEFIRRTHKIIYQSISTAYQFGVIPTFDGVGAHIHFSIWRDSDNKNMMVMQDEESVLFCEKVIRGIQTLIQEAPNLINEFDPQKPQYQINLSTGHGRDHAFKQHMDRIEIRRGYKSNFVHVARDLAFIMGGSMFGVHKVKDRKNFNETHNLSYQSKPCLTIANKYGGPLSALHKLVSRASLNQDSFLEIHQLDITQGIGNLLEDIGGEDHATLFTHKPPKSRETLDLKNLASWAAMINSIRVSDDGTLETTHLHPELQHAFDRVKVTGGRIVLESAHKASPCGIYHLTEAQKNLPLSRLVQFCFGKNNISAVMDETKNMLDKQSEQFADIFMASLLQKIKYSSDEPDTYTVKQKIRRQFYSKVILTTVEQELSLAIGDDDDDYDDAINRTHAQQLERGSSVTMLRPHFQAAAEKIMTRLRAEEKPDNFLISAAQDILEHVDKPMLRLNDYADTLFETSVLSYSLAVLMPYDKNIMKTALRRNMLHFVFIFIQIAAHDSRYTLDEILDDIKKFRDRLPEIDMHVDQFCRDEKEEVGAKTIRHVRNGKKFLKDTFYKALDIAQEQTEHLQKISCPAP